MDTEDVFDMLDRLTTDLRDPHKKAALLAAAEGSLAVPADEVDPERALSAAMLAQVLLNEYSPDEAARVFERLAVLFPDEPHYGLGVACCRVRQLRFEEAVAALTPLIEADPTNVAALSNRGEALLRLDRKPEALDDFRRAIASGPDPAAPGAHLALLMTVKMLEENDR